MKLATLCQIYTLPVDLVKKTDLNQISTFKELVIPSDLALACFVLHYKHLSQSHLTLKERCVHCIMVRFTWKAIVVRL